MKKVTSIHRGSEGHWVGDGFPVRTIFSYHDKARELTPFLLLDHAGPADFEPSETQRGVDWHPHRGFETVTIVYEGAVDHQDSAGNAGHIGPGDVQWMTAGAGVLHKELHGKEFASKGGRFEVLQLWVNLRAKQKMTAPAYQTILDADIPVVALSAGGGSVRVIAGGFGGVQGPARTFTPINLLDVRLTAGGRIVLPLRDGYTAALFVMKGRVTVNGDEPARAGELVLFERSGDEVTLEAGEDATVFVMNGEPIDEPVAGYGPFVMNTTREIEQAIADMRTGRFGRPATRAPEPVAG
jgi:redox-sensitive bicupin YhaK (pirin superfamily)